MFSDLYIFLYSLQTTIESETSIKVKLLADYDVSVDRDKLIYFQMSETPKKVSYYSHFPHYFLRPYTGQIKVKSNQEFVTKLNSKNYEWLLKSKGPTHLLGQLVSLVFTQEKLAQSCGQGLHKILQLRIKKALDPAKLSACKGM